MEPCQHNYPKLTIEIPTMQHTLRGQYECFTGNVDAIFRKQMHFKRLWDSMLIFRENGDHIIWMYTAPIILGNIVY